MCGPLLTVPNRHELYIDLQYTFSSSYFCGGPGNLEICRGDEEHAAGDEDGRHPRGGGDRGGDYLNDTLAARTARLHGHLPCKSPAALAHRPALYGGKQSGCVMKTVIRGVHGSLLGCCVLYIVKFYSDQAKT